MKYIDLTLAIPAENLACDEALLNLCEEGLEGDILRFWEPQQAFVVVGYANQAALEVDLEACRAGNIPVLRRCSGGGTVLQGIGCLNYTLILQIEGNQRLPEEAQALSSITSTNGFILERNRAALEPLLKKAIAIQGQTDLATGGLKFSGNAQRRQRRCLIFHGTFLLQFDIAQVGKYLRMPSKQPNYRRNRSHAEFLTNLNLSPNEVKAALRNIWRAKDIFAGVPTEKIHELAREKYSTDAWNFKL